MKQHKKNYGVSAALLALPLWASAVMAGELPAWQEETLTGDWGGTRASLWEKGVNVDITHKSDLLSNVSGGVATGSAWLMNTEAAVSLDMEKLLGWEGVSGFVQYHVQHGDASINDYTGSFAGVSNIETGTSTGQFWQAWLQKQSADGSMSLLGGLYAIDSEFYVTDASGLFLQPPYGMSTEMAQSGRNGPPVFPMGALGVRVAYRENGFYAQAALTDGVPGDPNDPHGTHIRLDQGDGTLEVAEFGYAPEVAEGQYNKTAIGFWRYSAEVADLDPAVSGMHKDLGAYAITEHTLLAESGDPAQGLAGFARIGFVNKDAYQADWSASLGLVYQGLFDGRDEDAAGIAVTNSHAGAKYQALNGSDSAETVVELTYRAQIHPWLAVQPSLQYIRNPNMDPALKDAWVAGARFEIAF